MKIFLRFSVARILVSRYILINIKKLCYVKKKSERRPTEQALDDK